MKKLRLLGIFVLAVLMVFSVVACDAGTTTQEPVQADDESTTAEAEDTETTDEIVSEETAQALPGEGMKFVAILPNSSNLSGLDMCNGAKEVLEAAGAQFAQLFYENNIDDMVQMIEDAISGGVNGIILQNTLNYEAGVDQLNECLEHGMVICELDGDYKEIEGIQYFYGANESELGYKIGQMAGEWANEALVPNGIEPQAGIYAYRGVPNFAERSEGMIKGLTETCPEAIIVRDEQADNTTDAMNKAENWLQAYPELNIIMGIGDCLSLGGVEALKAAGKDPKVTGCFGCDATEEALKGIATGDMYKGSLELGLNQVGKNYAQFMLDYLNGVEVAGREKYNYFPITMVTAANVDEYYTAE